MFARWTTLSLIAVVLVFVGIVAITAVLRITPDAIEKSHTGTALNGEMERLVATTDLWTVTAEIRRKAANEVAIVLKVENNTGAPAGEDTEVAASLRMLDMAMGQEPIPLSRERADQWRGIARLSMSGRWILEVTVNGEDIELPFESVAP